jgi:hypothetical protein
MKKSRKEATADSSNGAERETPSRATRSRSGSDRGEPNDMSSSNKPASESQSHGKKRPEPTADDDTPYLPSPPSRKRKTPVSSQGMFIFIFRRNMGPKFDGMRLADFFFLSRPRQSEEFFGFALMGIWSVPLKTSTKSGIAKSICEFFCEISTACFWEHFSRVASSFAWSIFSVR